MPTGEWIARTLVHRDAVAGLSAAERREYLAAEERAGRGTAVNLARQIIAAEWLTKRAKRFGVELSEVTAAYSAIEALSRLEADRPEHAEGIARDVLTGNITVAQVKGMAADRRKARTGRFWPSTIDVAVIEDIAPLLEKEMAAWATLSKGMTKLARLLKVDAELELKGGGMGAVFFSPQLRFAQNRSVVETWRAVVAARAFYRVVVFLTADPDEELFMHEHAPEREGDWPARHGKLGDVVVRGVWRHADRDWGASAQAPFKSAG